MSIETENNERDSEITEQDINLIPLLFFLIFLLDSGLYCS